MELALAIQDHRQLELFHTNRDKWQNDLMENERKTLAHIEHTYGMSIFDSKRLYFGSEFCQYRIPTVDDVKIAYEMSLQRGYQFTFVTPYVPEAGLQKLLPIFTWLHERDETVEVVVNDWGISYAVATQFPKFELNVGRLLNKMIRDPRVAHLYNEENAPQRAKSVFMNTSLDTPYFSQFLKRLNVKRIEFDSFIQPVEKTVDSFGIPASLYIGFGVIATGRSCLVGTLHKPKEEKFLGDVQCKQQCTHYVAKMENKRERLGEIVVQTMQKGNTAFYQQTDTLVEEGFEQAKRMGIDRIIVSPKIPV